MTEPVAKTAERQALEALARELRVTPTHIEREASDRPDLDIITDCRDVVRQLKKEVADRKALVDAVDVIIDRLGWHLMTKFRLGR